MTDCIDCEGRGWFHRRRLDPNEPGILVDRCETCLRFTDDADAQEAHQRTCFTCMEVSAEEAPEPELGADLPYTTSPRQADASGASAREHRAASALPLASRLENGHRGEDRLLALPTPAGVVVVVADGAGGVGGATKAAQTVCDLVARLAPRACGDAAVWTAALHEADLQCERLGGLTTAVIVEVCDGAVLGASVGDSGALLVGSGEPVELTVSQARKPLLGSGAATPVSFGPIGGAGRVLVASDGLFKYARPAAIAAGCGLPDLELAADALLRAAQLPNGECLDDVALALLQVPLR